MEIRLLDNHFRLLPQRAVYWKEQAALIVSDLHLGKTGHFRKAGIPVPPDLFVDDMQTLNGLVTAFNAQRLIVVGDMFHSRFNAEVDGFAAWRYATRQLRIDLILGNHDILEIEKYNELDLRLTNQLQIGPFLFSHEAVDEPADFCFSGHVHPGVRLEGAARQSLKFPCFLFTPNGCVLPAFSKFTGLSIISPAAGHRVFAIVGQEVLSC